MTRIITVAFPDGETAPGPNSRTLSESVETTYLNVDSNWENPRRYEKAVGISGTALAGLSIRLNARSRGKYALFCFLEHEYSVERHVRRSEGNFSTSGFQGRYGIRLQRVNRPLVKRSGERP